MDGLIYFLRRNWWWTLLALCFVIFVSLAIITAETITVSGTVLEHNVTADKQGTRTYSTIVKSDDGYIEEITGLETYVVPVGGRVTYSKKRHKPLAF